MQLEDKLPRADLAKDCPKFNMMAKIQWQRIVCTLFPWLMTEMKVQIGTKRSLILKQTFELIIHKELMQLVGKQQRAYLAKDCHKFKVSPF